MPIKFDTLEELKAFYQNFQLTGSAAPEREVPSQPKRGRKPGRPAVSKTATRTVKADTSDTEKSTVKKAGRGLKRGLKSVSGSAPAGKKTTAAKAEAAKKLKEKSAKRVGRKSAASAMLVATPEKKKPGRKPGSVNKKSVVAKAGRKSAPKTTGKTKTVAGKATRKTTVAKRTKKVAANAAG